MIYQLETHPTPHKVFQALFGSIIENLLFFFFWTSNIFTDICSHLGTNRSQSKPFDQTVRDQLPCLTFLVLLLLCRGRGAQPRPRQGQESATKYADSGPCRGPHTSHAHTHFTTPLLTPTNPRRHPPPANPIQTLTNSISFSKPQLSTPHPDPPQPHKRTSYTLSHCKTRPKL